MKQQIYVNLPVKDLGKSMAFFASLGYGFQKEFTSPQAACLIISDSIYVMLVTHDFFKSFSERTIADTTKVMEVQLAFNLPSRDAVDQMAMKAKDAGSLSVMDGKTDGDYMYSRAFDDLDGHRWDYFFMDPKSIPSSMK